VLILRDVLSWRSAEVARLLDLSVPAVNSALQRARETLSRRGHHADRRVELTHATSAGLLERYVRAWEAADVHGLVALLREDALLSMPPRPSVAGDGAIGDFLESAIFSDGARMRLVPAAANQRAAFVAYRQRAPDAPFDAFAVLVLEELDGAIARLDAFVDPRVLARFGPRHLPR